MAEVDFSHAKIAPAGSQNSSKYSYLNMDNSGVLFDSSYNMINTRYSLTKLTDAQKQFVFQYQGTFTASGTEFRISSYDNDKYWRIYNISFSSGDTYIFQIQADLICQ